MSTANGKKRPISRPQAMLNLRVLNALSLFASKDETRYYLQGVCIEAEERGSTYVGTDGHRLIAYRDDLAPDDDDNTLLGVFIVPTLHCKHFKLDKEDDGRAVLHGADAGRISIAHGFTDVTFMPIDGIYPHWRRSLPQGTPSGKVAQFNVTFLADLRKLTKQLSLSEPFIAHNGDAPAYIWFSGHPQVMGVIMPIKTIDEMEREAPAWVRRGPEREQGDIEDEHPLFTEEEHDPETGELPTEKPAGENSGEQAA
jgi:DNA polymerase III subunit beta